MPSETSAAVDVSTDLSAKEVPKILERSPDARNVFVLGKERAVLMDTSTRYTVEAQIGEWWTSFKLTPADYKVQQERTSPFTVDKIEIHDGDKATIELRPTVLSDIAIEAVISPDIYFAEDRPTLYFRDVLEKDGAGDNTGFVVWVRDFVKNLSLETLGEREKAEKIYDALVSELRGSNGVNTNHLLMEYLKSPEVQEVANQKGHRFREDDEPVCQHLASLLAFTFVAGGIHARNTRVYSEDYDPYGKPKGMVLVETADGELKGVDSLTMKLLDSPLDGIHSWTEAMIGGKLVPFDITWDIDGTRDPQFCGKLPPDELVGEDQLAKQAPGGKLYHVYPLVISWLETQSIKGN